MADQDGHKLGGASPAPAGGAKPPPGGGQPQFSASGKKLTVDFGEANQALTHLNDAFNALDRAYNRSWPLEAIKKPGREAPSTGFAGVANPVGKEKRQEILNKREAVRAMYDNLKAQLASQQQTEQTNAANHRRIGA